MESRVKQQNTDVGGKLAATAVPWVSEEWRHTGSEDKEDSGDFSAGVGNEITTGPTSLTSLVFSVNPFGDSEQFPKG